jgi:hypothetical protein
LRESRELLHFFDAQKEGAAGNAVGPVSNWY